MIEVAGNTGELETSNEDTVTEVTGGVPMVERVSACEDSLAKRDMPDDTEGRGVTEPSIAEVVAVVAGTDTQSASRT